jgi:hypothetical protein
VLKNNGHKTLLKVLCDKAWQNRRKMSEHDERLPRGEIPETDQQKKRGFGMAAGQAENERHPWSRRIRKKVGSRSISRVLSWTAIPLGALLPVRSSSLPGSGASHA